MWAAHWGREEQEQHQGESARKDPEVRMKDHEAGRVQRYAQGPGLGGGMKAHVDVRQPQHPEPGDKHEQCARGHQNNTNNLLG